MSNVRLTVMMALDTADEFDENPIDRMTDTQREFADLLLIAYPDSWFKPVVIPSVMLESLFGEVADPAAEVLDTRGTSNKDGQADIAARIQEQLLERADEFDSLPQCWKLNQLLAVYATAVRFYSDNLELNNVDSCEFYIRAEQETE